MGLCGKLTTDLIFTPTVWIDLYRFVYGAAKNYTFVARGPRSSRALSPGPLGQFDERALGTCGPNFKYVALTVLQILAFMSKSYGVTTHTLRPAHVHFRIF